MSGAWWNRLGACLGISLVVAYAACDSPTAPQMGALAIQTGGLPAEARPTVRLRIPGGSERDISGLSSIADLAPGEYVVLATQVTIGGRHYVPAPAAIPVTIRSAATATVKLTYTLADAVVTLAPDLPTVVLDAISIVGSPIDVTAPGGAGITTVAAEPGMLVYAADRDTLPRLYGVVDSDGNVELSVQSTAEVIGALASAIAGRTESMKTLAAEVRSLPRFEPLRKAVSVAIAAGTPVSEDSALLEASASFILTGNPSPPANRLARGAKTLAVDVSDGPGTGYTVLNNKFVPFMLRSRDLNTGKQLDTALVQGRKPMDGLLQSFGPPEPAFLAGREGAVEIWVGQSKATRDSTGNRLVLGFTTLNFKWIGWFIGEQFGNSTSGLGKAAVAVASDIASPAFLAELSNATPLTVLSEIATSVLKALPTITTHVAVVMIQRGVAAGAARAQAYAVTRQAVKMMTRTIYVVDDLDLILAIAGFGMLVWDAQYTYSIAGLPNPADSMPKCQEGSTLTECGTLRLTLLPNSATDGIVLSVPSPNTPGAEDVSLECATPDLSVAGGDGLRKWQVEARSRSQVFPIFSEWARQPEGQAGPLRTGDRFTLLATPRWFQHRYGPVPPGTRVPWFAEFRVRGELTSDGKAFEAILPFACN